MSVSYRTGDTIKYPVWLVFDKSGDVRMTRRQPACAATERAMSLDINLPLSLFATPSLSAHITVADGGLEPVVIDLPAVADAVRGVVGVEVVVTRGPDE